VIVAFTRDAAVDPLWGISANEKLACGSPRTRPFKFLKKQSCKSHWLKVTGITWFKNCWYKKHRLRNYSSKINGSKNKRTGEKFRRLALATFCLQYTLLAARKRGP
jgi:hypothetical protein